MRWKQYFRGLFSRLDFFRVSVGFFFEGQSSYHSKFSTFISILVLGISIYLPFTISEGPILNTKLYRKDSTEAISFDGNIKVEFNQTKQWVLDLRCVTIVNNLSLQQIIPIQIIENGLMFVVTEGYNCNLRSSQNTLTNLKLSIGCNNCSPGQIFTAKLIVQNNYIVSVQNKIVSSPKNIHFKFIENTPLLYQIPVYSQTFQNYDNWFIGSFGLFPQYRSSYFIKQVTPSISSSLNSLQINFQSTDKKIYISKEYPSGLNYGLSVLAIYGIIRSISNLLFLRKFTKKKFYLKRGLNYYKNNGQQKNINKIKSFLVAFLPEYVVEKSRLSLYFKQQVKIIQKGKSLLNLQSLFQLGNKMVWMQNGRQPIIKAEVDIDSQDRNQILNVVEHEQVLIEVNSLGVDEVRKMQSSKKNGIKSSKLMEE